jgi:phosphatidate cytidylyltransferase
MDTFLHDTQFIALIGIFALFSIAGIAVKASGRLPQFGSYLRQFWLIFLIFIITNSFSFRFAIWLWGFLCFFILREFFSLIDFRPQDRFGIIAAYLSIPFMMHYVVTDWYNMFIIAIPVYSFLVIPFLIAAGGKDSKGAIHSIGIIIFGLFIFVYCIGHIAYLSYYSFWTAVMLVLNIVICDLALFFAVNRASSNRLKLILGFICPVPFTILLALVLSGWTGIPAVHSIILGLIIPALAMIGNFTIQYLESDLGIKKDDLKPGKGLLIENMRSIFYAAPVVMHYFRCFMGDLIS